MKTYFEIPDLSAPAAVAIGTFDGCHLGHQAVIRAMIEQARQKGLLAVVLSFQNHPFSVLAPDQVPPLLSTCREKELALAALAPDLAVLLKFTPEFSRLSPEAFIRQILCERLKVRYVSVGFNFRFGHQAQGTPELLAQMGSNTGFEVVIQPPFLLEDQPVNSSRIRTLLQAGQHLEACRMLGEFYLIAGRVIRGQGIAGSLLGVPTANVALESPYKLLPPRGVYLCQVQISGRDQRCPGIMNLGMRPTFEGLNLSLEVHLLDFNADLYEQEIQVFVGQPLRPEKRFASPELLREQIHADLAQARQLLSGSV